MLIVLQHIYDTQEPWYIYCEEDDVRLVAELDEDVNIITDWHPRTIDGLLDTGKYKILTTKVLETLMPFPDWNTRTMIRKEYFGPNLLAMIERQLAEADITEIEELDV